MGAVQNGVRGPGHKFVVSWWINMFIFYECQSHCMGRSEKELF